MSALRSRRAAPSIDRPRIASLLADAPLVMLEAPGGYGKTTVALHWAAALDLPVVQVTLREATDLPRLLAALRAAFGRAGLLALADAVDPDDSVATLAAVGQRLDVVGSVVIFVDEIQRADDAAARWIGDLAEALPRGSYMAVAGRRIPNALAQHGIDGWTRLDVEDLRFDVTEVATFLTSVSGGERPAESETSAVLETSGGWPAAVALTAAVAVAPARQASESRLADIAMSSGLPAESASVAASASSTSSPSSALSRERVLRQLMGNLLSAVDEDTRRLAGRAAQLPLLSTEVAEVLGGEGALAKLADAGLPIRVRGDGWAELPDSVREYFGEESLPGSVARSVAAIYSSGGELAEAVTLLARAGDHSTLLSLVAHEHPAALLRVGLGFFEVVISQTPDAALAASPEALVQVIRAAERSTRLRDIWLERAGKVLGGHYGSAARAVEAERAFAEARAGDLTGSVARAERVLATADASETTTLGRACMVRAYGHLLSATAAATSAAAADLERAVACFRLAGERAWEAEAHQAIGYGCLFTTGAFDAAIERLERSLALRSAPDANRSEGLTYYAEVLAEAGRYADAEIALREARAIAHRLGDERSIAYAAWSVARLAARRRGRATAIASLAEAEAHPGEWLSSLAGVDFLADAAVVRMRVGDVAGALVDIERAEALAAGTARVDVALTARARYEATIGDPRAALALVDRVDRSPIAFRSDHWNRVLLRAVALERAGDHVGAAASLEEAQRLAAQDGDQDRLSREESDLVVLVRPSAPEAPSLGVTIQMLGRFAVTRGAVDVSPPPGRPSTLVKLLALRGTMTADEVIDILWPEADLDVGRARLRNLLNRVRATSGELVDRQRGTLALRGDVVIDAVRFESEAAAAISAPVAERAATGRRALAWSTGELLPEDRYADWADLPRERLARRRLDLLDLVANDAIARGDLVEASQLLDAAIADDPLDEMRYVRLARALLTQGRSHGAAEVIRRAVAVANDLGVKPGDEVAALAAEIDAIGHAR